MSDDKFNENEKKIRILKQWIKSIH